MENKGLAEVGTATSSTADSLEELRRRRDEEQEQQKELEKSRESSDKTKSPDQKDQELRQSERAQQRTNNPFRQTEARTQNKTSPQERLKTAVPGYRDDKSPEAQEKNANLLLERLSGQIEKSKEKMGAERDEYPGAPTGLSGQQQVAAAQIAAEQRQRREEKLRETQKQELDKKETIYDLAKELIGRGLHDEASKILGKHVLGQEADKTITQLERTKAIHDSSSEYQLLRLDSQSQIGIESAQETQAEQYRAMSPDEQKDHTLDLMSGLVEKIDQSSERYLSNERVIADLESLREGENSRYSDPGQALVSLASSTRSLLQARQNDERKLSPETLSFIQKSGGYLTKDKIDQELAARKELREKLTGERTRLLRAQANIGKLAANGQADQIHLLFDKNGEPLSQAQLRQRTSDPNLTSEARDQYLNLNDFLRRDQNFEAEFKAMHESLLGLSPEEQAVRARDFLGAKLQEQKTALIALKEQDQALGQLLERSWADQKGRTGEQDALELMAVDQQIISSIAEDSIKQQMETMYRIHDGLTETLNNKNYQQGLESFEERARRLEAGLYVYGNDSSSSGLINRDIARTPQETERLQERIKQLEKDFNKLTEDQRLRAKTLLASAQRDIDTTLDITKGALNPYGSSAWRVGHGETDLILERANSSIDHYGRLIKNLEEQKNNREDSQYTLARTGQLERYGRELEEIIQAGRDGQISAGKKAGYDLNELGKSFRELDQSFARTEDRVRFARNAAIIAAATIATGGGAAYLAGTYGLGTVAAGAGGFMIGGSTGTGIGFAANLGEGAMRDAHGFEDPYSRVLSQTYDDAKMSFTTAAATATGMTATKALAETYKWGRLASTLSGASASSFVSTTANHGIKVAESYVQTGEAQFNTKEYLKDLLWNTSSSAIGAGIGYKFGGWQNNASQDILTQSFLHGSEEALSIGADIAMTALRDGEVTTDALLQSFQSSIIGRVNGHYSQAAAVRDQAAKNQLAHSIKNQKMTVRGSDTLEPGVNGRAKVSVAPDGTRTVEVEIRQDVLERAAAGDAEAQKIVLEETVGHGRENPIDPLVKQADGSYKPMSEEQYSALRARQELVQRSVAEAKYADAKEQDVSAAKQELKAVLKAIDAELKSDESKNPHKYQNALRIAEQYGVHPGYRANFKQDYLTNVNRANGDALEQTSHSADATTGTAEQEAPTVETENTPSTEDLPGSRNETLAKAMLQEIQSLEELQRQGPRLLAEANGNAQKIQELIKARETEIYHSTIDKALKTKPELAHELSNLRNNENPEIRRIATEALAAKNPEETSRVIKALNNLDLTNINDPLVQRVLENTPYAKTNNKDGDPVDQAIEDIETQISLLNRYNGDSGPASPNDSPDALFGLSDHLDTLKRMVAKDGVSAKEDADMEALHLKAYQTIEEAQQLFEKLQPKVLQHVKRGGAEPTELQQQYTEKLKELERITKTMSNTAVDIIDRNFARRKELHDLGINEDQYKMVRDIYTNPEEAKAAAEKISSNLIDTVRPQLETEDLNKTYLGIDKAVDQLKTENEAIQEALALDYLIKEKGGATTVSTLSTQELQSIQEANSKAIRQLEQLKNNISSFQSNTNGRKNEAQEKALKLQAQKINEELTRQQNKTNQAAQALEQKQDIKTKLGLDDTVDLSQLGPEEVVKFNEILDQRNLSEGQKELLKDAIEKKRLGISLNGYFKVAQMDQKIAEAAIEFTKSTSTNRIREIEQKANYLNEIKDFKGFDEYLANLREIAKEYDDDFLRQDIVSYKNQKFDDSRQSELERTMQGVFAERNILRSEISSPDRNILNINSTGILGNKIIDSSGEVIFDSSTAHEGNQDQVIKLERNGATDYKLIDSKTGEEIQVYNGNNKASKVIMTDEGILKSNDQPVSIVYDKESGRYIAREIDLVSQGNIGNVKNKIFLQEIKDKASTARNKYGSDDGRQFRALIAISKHLGATPVIRINETSNVLQDKTNQNRDRSFNDKDRSTYKEMISVAKEMGVDLIFVDKEGNIINI